MRRVLALLAEVDRLLDPRGKLQLFDQRARLPAIGTTRSLDTFGSEPRIGCRQPSIERAPLDHCCSGGVSCPAPSPPIVSEIQRAAERVKIPKR